MIDEEKITKQVRIIMDNFIRALNKAEGIKEEFGSERKYSMRTEIKKHKDPEFRRRMFMNAPKKKDNFFVMEKKNW